MAGGGDKRAGYYAKTVIVLVWDGVGGEGGGVLFLRFQSPWWNLKSSDLPAVSIPPPHIDGGHPLKDGEFVKKVKGREKTYIISKGSPSDHTTL